jgi:hypothetical protein
VYLRHWEESHLESGVMVQVRQKKQFNQARLVGKGPWALAQK